MRPRSMVLALASVTTLIVGLHAAPARANCEDAVCRLPARETQRIRATPVNQRLSKLVRDQGLRSFQKNGRLYFATTSSTNMDHYLAQLSPNIVEFFVSPGFHHLYTRVGDNTYSRISGLSESGWYRSSSERIGVIARFTDSEMGRLKKYINSACQNPDRVLGPFVYGGGRPPQASNCTSWITNAKIGDHGESLARLLGVWESGMPQGFLSSMMSSGNNRIEAVVVHNPAGNFGPSYRLDLH